MWCHCVSTYFETFDQIIPRCAQDQDQNIHSREDRGATLVNDQGWTSWMQWLINSCDHKD